MKRSDDRRTSRLARAFGLLVVLGLPLTVAAPLNRGTVPSDLTASQPAAPKSDLPARGAGAPGTSAVEGYVGATPAVGATAEPVVKVHPSEPGRNPVTTISDDPRCGRGFTSVSSQPGTFSCLHTTLDTLSPIAGPVAQMSSAAPVCIGNGVNGPRIQLIYMYVEGQPDRSAHMIPRIINQIVPRMEATFRETSKFQGREIGMRLHMPGCKLTVDTVMIDEDSGQPDDPFVMHGKINQALTDAGYGSTDRKFHIWFDGGNKGACGIAPAYTAALERGANPTPANTSNIGWHRVMISGEAAITFRYGAPILGAAPSDPLGRPAMPECFGRGAVGAHTELHELLHLIGAVGWTAPNWNTVDSHCLDDNDIMCQTTPNGPPKFIRCNTVVEQLDCGGDDYFNARPQAGSYLSTHWNTANSRFLGAALGYDDVPVEIPRP